MTFRGFILRLVLVASFTWIVGALVESFGLALYWALFLIGLIEVLRPRGPRRKRGKPGPGPPPEPPTR